MEVLKDLELLVLSRYPMIAVETYEEERIEEILKAVVSALYTAFAHGDDLNTPLVLDEIKATRPLSVTRHEEVAALRAWACGRTVPA